MNNELALCPKCNTFSFIKVMTFGTNTTKGNCTNCEYKVDRLSKSAGRPKAVNPHLTTKQAEWSEQSKANIHKLSQRGKHGTLTTN